MIYFRKTLQLTGLLSRERWGQPLSPHMHRRCLFQSADVRLEKDSIRLGRSPSFTKHLPAINTSFSIVFLWWWLSSLQIASATGSIIDVAAELLIHIDRNAVTPIRPAILLFNQTQILTLHPQRTITYHFVDDPTVLRTKRAMRRWRLTDSIAQANKRLPKKRAIIFWKNRGATTSAVRTPAWINVDHSLNARKRGYSSTIGKRTIANSEVTGNGIASKIQ